MNNLNEWVPRLQAGEDEAWQEFIRVYGRFVPVVSRRLGLTAEDREEVLQEMTLTAYRSIRNLRDPGRLASWAYTIARRAAIGQLRAKLRHPIDRSDDPPDPDDFPSRDIPIDEVMIDAEAARRLRSEVAGLKPACRRLIEDLFLEEPRLSYKEVSERHGMPLGSIGPTLARCLQALRQAWKSVSGGS